MPQQSRALNAGKLPSGSCTNPTVEFSSGLWKPRADVRWGHRHGTGWRERQELEVGHREGKFGVSVCQNQWQCPSPLRELCAPGAVGAHQQSCFPQKQVILGRLPGTAHFSLVSVLRALTKICFEIFSKTFTEISQSPKAARRTIEKPLRKLTWQNLQFKFWFKNQTKLHRPSLWHRDPLIGAGYSGLLSKLHPSWAKGHGKAALDTSQKRPWCGIYIKMP